MELKSILKALQEKKITPEEARAAMQKLQSGNTVTDSDKKSNHSINIESDNPRNIIHSSKATSFDEDNNRIAIIGISGRYPTADNMDGYWDVLVNGKNTIREIPKTRWDTEKYYDPDNTKEGKIYSKWLGMLDDVDCFDSLFFEISPSEAEVMDPQHRLFLEEGYKAFEDAGYNISTLNNTKCGVYLGIVNGEYDALMNKNGTKNTSVTGNSNAIGVARIAYYLNLKGPAISIDTACSSSLVSTHLAIQALRNREVDMALAGGVSLYLSPESYVNMCAAGMLSPDGQCKAFDNSANGFVPGEGVGAIVLKRLKDAVADGDYIYGTIIGSAINQDGKTNGITAPNLESQIELVNDLYSRYQINPESISYAELHGTGTKLGDPIELEALATAFGKKTNAKNYCAIGSVKSNLGHTSAAAAMAGIHKIILSMKHKKLVPTLHVQTPNEHFDFHDSPFYINCETTDWNGRNNTPRRAAISSFGYSGTNAHAVIEEYEMGAVERKSLVIDENHPGVFVLSAKNGTQLMVYVEKMKQYLDNYQDSVLADVLFTLQVGREPMNERLAIITYGKEDLTNKLSLILEGNLDSDCLRGRISKKRGNNKQIITNVGSNTKHEELPIQKLYDVAQSWVNGEHVDWKDGYVGYEPQRIPLPTYPFEREVHWFQEKEADFQSLSLSDNSITLHPLLHHDTSNFDEHSFQSIFTGNEFFVTDHIINNRKVLPGTAILEMARKAGELLGEENVSSLRNISWNHPISVEDGSQNVKIRLFPQENNTTFEVSISNQLVDDKTDEIICAEGVIEYGNIPRESQALNIRAYKSRCLSSVDTKKNYENMRQNGLIYGPDFQTVTEIYYNDNEVLAKLELTDSSQSETKDYVLHPGLLDGAMQTISVFLQGQDDLVYLPFSMGRVNIFSSLTKTGYVYTTLAANSGAKSRLKSFDIVVTDEVGNILVEINNFNVRPVQATSAPINNDRFTEAAVSVEASPTSYYKKVWVVEDSKRSKKAQSGAILLFDVNKDLYNALRSITDSKIILVQPGKQYDHIDEYMVVMNPSKKDDYKTLLEVLIKSGLTPNKIIYNWGNDSSIHGQHQLNNRLERGVYSILALSQAITEVRLNTEIQLLYVYYSSQKQLVPEQSAMSGFFITLHKENQLFNYKTVELANPSISITKIASFVMDEFLVDDHDFGIRYDGINRWVTRIKNVEENEVLTHSDFIKNNGVYMITGGMGGLGLIFARYLSNKRNIKIVLTGRRELSAHDLEEIKELEALGSEVLYVRADVSKREDVEELIKKVKAKFARIDGVIHSAGVIRDSLYLKKHYEEVKEVLAAKVFGTKNLDEALQNEILDFFVVFSSLASVVGNVGQCDYSYGNSYLDHFASAREELRAKGKRYGKTLSINWPFWEEGGMYIDQEAKKAMEEDGGIFTLNSNEGIKAFEDGLHLNVPQLIVIKGVQEKIMELIDSVTGQKMNKAKVLMEQGSVEVQVLETKDDHQEKIEKILREETNQFLKGVLSEKTKIPVEKIDMLEPFEKYGIDSILIMSLTRLLEKSFGELSKTLFFEYRNLEELSEYFLQDKRDMLMEMFGTLLSDNENKNEINEAKHDEKPLLIQEEQSKVIPTVQDTDTDSKQDDIAIIGVSGRYPHADNLEEFWDVISNGKDCITEIPKERWDYRKFYDPDKQNLGKSYSKWGGFIRDVAMFDALFFNIPPIEAEVMDPQARLFMEVAWHTLEDAGYTRASLEKDKVGVFVGVMNGMYELFESEIKGKTVPVGSSFASIANQVSYFCNFNGPSMAIDTMCSSSLTALHLGAESIRNGESDLAIAGGVNLIIHPNKHLLLSMGKFASSDGRCRSFGEGGDGYVPGEGIGAVLLKPLKKAIADKDHIYGVLKGSAINSGGKTSGFTVPNPNAQGDLVANVFQKSGIDPRTISYIETHGTGTSLGDPIEITGLTKAFKREQGQEEMETQYCSIGSVKSNIGHLESAAGIAALTKVLLQMQKKKLVPSIHSSPLNPNINFKNTPFYVQRHLQDWEEPVITEGSIKRKVPRRAGISSFGAGGSNAHIIVEEYQSDLIETLVDRKKPNLFVVSAKNKERVREYIRLLTDYLRQNCGMNKKQANKIISKNLSFDTVQQTIKESLSGLLGIHQENIDSEVSMQEYGLDIVQSTKLKNAINLALDIELPEIEVNKELSIYSLATLIMNLVDNDIDSHNIEGKKDVNVTSIAYTLQVGREAMEERVAIIAESSEELLQKLELYLDGKANINQLYEGNVLDNKQNLQTIIEENTRGKAITDLLENGKLENIAKLWVAGASIDWNLLYQEEKPHRITLPTYPFSKERFWPKVMKESVSNQAVVVEVIHPLLNKNTSNIHGLRYSTVFHGNEFFLEDHMINGKKILPGVAYIEMARAALEDLLDASEKESSSVQIQHVVWLQPFEVSGKAKTLHISILPNEYDQLKFTIFSDSEEESMESIVHCEGTARFNQSSEQSSLDIDWIKSECNFSKKSGESFYRYFEKVGINYGPSHRGIKEVYKGENQLIASLSLPEIEGVNSSKFRLHPSLLDSALQATIAFSLTEYSTTEAIFTSAETNKQIHLPFALEEIEIMKDCSAKMWAYIYKDMQQKEEKIQKINIDLCDDEGNICVRIKGLAFRTLQSEDKATNISQVTETNKLLFTKRWREVSVLDNKENQLEHNRIVFLCDPDQQTMYHIETRLHNTKCIPLRSHATNLSEKYTDYAVQLLHETRKILSNKINNPVFIQLFISTKSEDRTLTGLLGFLKTMQLENHHFVTQLVESQQDLDAENICKCLEESGELPYEQHVRYRNQKRYVSEMEQTSVKPSSHMPHCWKDQGLYLITGGAGGLGAIIANEIAQKAKQVTLLLLGRSPFNPNIEKQIKNLEALGAQAIYRQVDVTDKQQVENLIQEVVNQFGAINGVIHCSGIIRDNFIVKKDEEELRAVLAPKVSGIYNLDEATKEMSLDLFIIFSSLAGIMGNIGQADYATGNAFMDSFAEYRNQLVKKERRSGHAISINWPLWRDGGMQISGEMEEIIQESTGLVPMQTSTAIELLYESIHSGQSQALALEGEYEKIIRYLYRHTSERKDIEGRLEQEKENIVQENMKEKFTNILKQMLSSELNLDVGRIDPRVSLETYGINSIMIMQLTNQLEKSFGSLPKTLFFEYQSLLELTDYFCENYPEHVRELTGVKKNPVIMVQDKPKKIETEKKHTYWSQMSKAPSRKESNNGTTGNTIMQVNNDMDIAIIGVSGKYPHANTLKEFWNILKDGKDCITEIPKERWDHSIYYDDDKRKLDKTYAKWGGFLDGIDQFDPLFFNIAPSEAQMLDPQERLFLQCAYNAIEDAGYTRYTLGKNDKNSLESNVGVYVGVMYEEYQLYGAQAQAYGHMLALSGSPASIANRVSYISGFNGPSMAVDTMCSSSLVSIHLACQSIRNGECDTAIAGGVNLSLHPNKFLMLGQNKFMSSKGRCQSFGKDGDGYTPGEGVGAVILKPKAKAIEDGDNIYGIIKGSAVNHGGKTNGYTVPNPRAQTSVISKVLKRSGVDPRTISYIEAHGTGTALGDPIEIAGLNKAFEEYTKDKQFCLVGSVKSNIGHCESAAGIAGLTKVLLQMKHKKIAPSLHSSELNPNIDFEQSPFIVSQKLTDWKRPIVERDGVKKEYPRIAGISAFGAGGANAHLIVEEYIPEEPEIVTEDEQSEDPVMITLSARKEEQLKEVVKQLITWLHDEQPSYEKLKNIAYTLQVGRESMEERLAFIVTSSMDLEEKLTEYLSGSGDYYRGQAKSINNVLHVLDSDQEFQNVLNTWFKLGKYSKILELWVKGLTIDWDNFYFIDERRKRISLPTYPFAKERYWIPEVEGVLSDNQIANSVHYIHPLVHSNSSDFSQQKYSSLFTGEESFFTDHLVNGRKTMPAVAYIEMAYAAIRNAFNMDENDPSTFEFRDITWIRPLTVDNAVEVHIALDLEENSQVSFEIYSESDEGNSEKVIYCEGFAVISAGTESPEIDLRERLNNCNVMKLQSDTIYNQFDSIGIQYGDKQRGIESLNLGKEQVLAHLVLPDSLEASLVDYRLHPCMLDSAFQAAIGMTLAEEQLSNESTTAALAPKLPFMIKRMTVYKDITSIMWSSIRPSNQDIAEKGELLDIDLCNTDGELCVRMEEVYFRSLKQSDRESNLEGHTSKGEAENEKIESLTIIPEWKESALDRSRDTRPYTKRIAILCEVDNHIQQELYTKCTDYDFITIQSDSSNIAHRFQEYAVTILEEIKKLMHSHTQDRNLIQIYIPLASNNYPLLGLASLLKTANLENPTIFGQVIGIEDQHDTNQIATWLVDNATYSQDHSVLYRDGKRLVQTLKEHDSMLPGKPVWKNNGVYLITGGMGGLGLIFAKEIVNKVKNAVIVLTGRSPLTTEKQAKLHELIKNDATVLYESVDVSVKDSVENVIEKIETNFGKITGIIHSAGLVNDNLIYKKTRQEFLDVLTPKIQGIVNLDMASKDLDLDFLVICSSLSGVTGNVGQADYATANAFMDAYATHRNELVKQNQRNGQTLSLNWPLWQDGGMTIDESLQKSIIVRTGMTSLRTETGLELFYRSLSLQESQVIPVEGFADKIRSLLLEHENHNKADVEVILPNREVIEPTNEGLYEKSVLFIKQIFADALMIPIQDIDEDEPLDRYGIDSILIMKLTDILEGTFGSLPKTLLFEYQNINAITKYLVDRHQDKLINHIGVSGDEAHSNKEEIKPVSVKAKDVKTVRKKQMVQDIQSGIVKQLEETSTDNDIAIVGMSGAFAQADDIEEYWKNLLQGRDCITEVPLSRWDHSKYFNEDVNNPGTAYTKWGGFMKNVDKFDPLFFNITPTDAVIMDPQERLFMKSVYEAIEDAGYTRHELGYNPGSDVRRNVGVYVGVMNEDYQLYAAQEQKVGNPIVLSGNPASIANRVSYFFDFHGPSLAIDTMCSSSLVAIHMACQAIKQGECEYAIAGGVNVMSHPNKYLLISQSKFASTNGRCVSFGKDGDGYVPGEGVGTLLLKSKEQAIKDGDHIYGVIKGSSVNHGGKTNGYTVPNPNAQSEVIRTALNAANITPDTLSYIEAHGTGTALGDPIEIIALQKAFGENVDNTQKCAIGSVKSNIGHCESASGIASIAKVLLQMKHKKIVPSLHSSELNPNIDFENSPFYVPQQVMEWNRPKVNRDGSVKEYPRRSGISSFGAGGANAHIILEEFIPNENEEKKEDSTLSKKPVVIVVSSKTKEQLKVQVNNLINAIHSQKIMENNLLDVAYTLQVGREEMEERMAFVSDSVDMLMQKLNEFLTVQENAEGVYYGQVYGKARSLQDYDTANLSMDVQTCIRLGHYEKLCEYWVNGITIDWKSLYQNRPKRVSLPTYPFENERFWVTITPDTPSKETPVAKEIHPLIHENNSSLYRQNFRSNFSGNEFFLKDHCLGERKVLPGAATLEMARFVGKLSLETDVNVLKNVIWINQFEVSNEPKDIEVKVFSDNDTTNYEISTVVEGSGSGEAENELICSEGQLEYRDDLYATLDSKTIHIEDIKSRCHRIEDGNDCYRAMTERGLINGPSFQVIQEIYSNEFEALSFMSLEADSVDSLSHYVLHPALLNGVFQSVLGLMRSQNETNPTVFLPFALSEMKIIEPMTKECIAYVKQSNHTKKSQSSSIQKFDITITDKSGRILAIIDEFTLKAFQVIDSVQDMVGDEYPSSFYSLNNEPVLENQYFMTDWSETFYMEGQEVMNDQAQGTIVIFDQDETLFREIQALYREENHSDVILVKPGETCQSLGKNIYEINPLIQEDYEQIIQMLIDQKTSLTRIIFHTKDGKYARTDDELTEHLEHGIYSLFYLSQALMKQKINYNVQLLFAFENEEGRVIPEYSAVSGFAKTIRMEKPSFTFKTVELQKVRTIHGESDDSHIAKVLVHEFEIEDSEVEIRYEGRNRLVKEVKSI